MTAKTSGRKLIGSNKQARRLYELIDFFEAGIALQGSEVKSLRDGKVSFKDGYVRFENHEAFLTGVHIAPYKHAGYAGHDPDRDRKLLLHKTEILKLEAAVDQKGLTVVPVKMYFSRGKAKVEIATARGKKVHDRREEIKQRDIERETARDLAKF